MGAYSKSRKRGVQLWEHIATLGGDIYKVMGAYSKSGLRGIRLIYTVVKDIPPRNKGDH